MTRDIARRKTHLLCGEEGPRDVEDWGYGGSRVAQGIDDSFSVEYFKENFKIEVTKCDSEELLFDMSGLDSSFANGFRRILLAEVPSMAIETVHMYQNTGVIQDEVLAHRIGLVPIVLDPEKFEERQSDEELSEKNCTCFELKVTCTPESLDPKWHSMPVYAKDLKWTPMSKEQKAKFKADPPRVAVPELLITKLRPGQEIDAKFFVEKGVGRTHAKWTPVATTCYRLLPVFSFPKGPIQGADAQDLVSSCPMKVFKLRRDEAVVADARSCTTCRLCFERFPERVVLEKQKDFFICEC
ncbi:MAG: hypothetical protein KVP17_000150 [Porospora cf. gigantea B]|uniref:uncharacterized protein n=1 Tax=Porospora cf. gigantea B TaxID=2853592 RepID=UPI003571D2EB|nr:MAG: hypothetical protein KVP17_000150 [Porospora cf. gigantea B]